MACDTTLTVYKAREKERGSAGGYKKPSREKMDEAYRKWKLRKAQGAFDLKRFLGNKDKKENGEEPVEHKP